MKPKKREGPPLLTSPILEQLKSLHREYQAIEDGEVATYIPELAKTDPEIFGICVVTTSGSVYEVGDSSAAFTIQSISKPFVYGMALEDRGRSELMTKVGVEPTGDAFNSISLDAESGRPRNPMINAGAIAVTGLIEGKSVEVRRKRILEMFARYAGRELGEDAKVFRSECETGHRNRAIGHMLRNFNVLGEEPTPSVELYFHQCSIAVTCRDLAVMAATLANRGVNPLTGKQALRGEYVESVLGVMGTCGMYDYAGEWLFSVGIPAKSGVSGGVIAVVPGQLGIGVFSPRLDSHGNSVRGIRVCEALSRHWDLHLFNRPGARSAIRLKIDGARFNSNRVRVPDEIRALHEHGAAIRLYQLEGNLTFTSAEVFIRDLVENAMDAESVILDFKRVLSINESACGLLHDILLQFAANGRPLVFVEVEPLPHLRRYMKVRLGARFEDLFRVFDDNDLALEWCEDRLLARVQPNRLVAQNSGPGGCQIFSGMTPAEIAIVTPMLQRRAYKHGEVIISAGDPASDIFLVASGRVSVVVRLQSDRDKRLATFTSGMVFGEMAVIDHAPRSATIIADEESACDLLSIEDFDTIGLRHPGVKIKLLGNLCLDLCGKLRKANREITVFE